MHWTKRNFLWAPEGAAGGGSATVETPEETEVESSVEGELLIEGDTAEDDEAAEEDGETTEEEAAEGEEATEGEDLPELTAEQIAALAAKHGLVKKPEEKPADKAATQEPVDADKAEAEFLSANPRQLAYEEAQALGKDADWAETRTFEILEQQQCIRDARLNAPVHVSQIADAFEKQDLPREAAPVYYDYLVRMEIGGVKKARLDPNAQQAALRYAIGDAIIKGWRPKGDASSAEKIEEKSARAKSIKTPTSGGGSGAIDIAKLDKGDQRFLANWQASKNGGKPPTAKQLADLKKEGLIG